MLEKLFYAVFRGIGWVIGRTLRIIIDLIVGLVRAIADLFRR